MPMTLIAAGFGGQNAFSSKLVSALCSILSPFVGQHSAVLSVLLIIVLIVMLFLWWFNENKEGMLVWVIRTGLVLAVLINAFTIPMMLGMANPCG